jgi:branched-subunit amino acid ABC-type transport system permease component
MQAVRSLFGAQNVAVENPSWMSGGVEVLPNLLLPYNRLSIIAFALLVLLGLYLVISKTRLGLFVRGVTQNRPMASCVGVNTARVAAPGTSMICPRQPTPLLSVVETFPKIPITNFRIRPSCSHTTR